MKDLIASFPHLANYYVAIKLLLEKGIGVKTIVPPPITKKTLELGSKYSPDFVCSPFKYNLGNYIESLELGANVLIQSGGLCRFGYYGELQEQILKDLGYNFEFISLPINNKKEYFKIYKQMRKMGFKISIFKFLYYLLLTIKMVKKIDVFEDCMRKNIGFEIEDGSFDRLHKQYLEELETATNFKKLKQVDYKYTNLLASIKIEKPNNLLRVGIVGELYTLQDGFSNHYLEKELAKKGVEITRYVNADYLLFKCGQDEKKLLKSNSKYACHDLGAGGLDSVVKSEDFALKKYDGIIHVKAFGCTPEINAMPILQNIASDYGIPILYFSFDTATSETGVRTRIEAFYDMLVMRRGKRK